MSWWFHQVSAKSGKVSPIEPHNVRNPESACHLNVCCEFKLHPEHEARGPESPENWNLKIQKSTPLNRVLITECSEMQKIKKRGARWSINNVSSHPRTQNQSALYQEPMLRGSNEIEFPPVSPRPQITLPGLRTPTVSLTELLYRPDGKLLPING